MGQIYKNLDHKFLVGFFFTCVLYLKNEKTSFDTCTIVHTKLISLKEMQFVVDISTADPLIICPLGVPEVENSKMLLYTLIKSLWEIILLHAFFTCIVKHGHSKQNFTYNLMLTSRLVTSPPISWIKNLMGYNKLRLKQIWIICFWGFAINNNVLMFIL